MRGVGRDAAYVAKGRFELADQRAAGIGIDNRVIRIHGIVDGGLNAVFHPVPLVGDLIVGDVQVAGRGGEGIADARVLVVDGDGSFQLRSIAVHQCSCEVRLAAELCGGVGGHMPAPGGLHALAGLDALAVRIAGPADQLVGGRGSGPRHINCNGPRVPQRYARDGCVAGAVDEHVDLARCCDRRGVGICLPGRCQDACRNGDDGD